MIMSENKRRYAKRLGQEVKHLTLDLASKIVEAIERVSMKRNITKRQLTEQWLRLGSYADSNFKQAIKEHEMSYDEFIDMCLLERIKK